MNTSKKKDIVKILFVILTLFHLANAQSAEINANELLERARKNSDPKNILKDLKAIELNYESQIRRFNSKNASFDESSQIRLAYQPKDKIYYEAYSDFGTNQQLFTQVLNGFEYKEDMQVLVDGKPINFQSNLESLKPKVTKQEQIKGITKRNLIMLFPLILQPGLLGEVKISYLGEAEFDNKKAQIIAVKDNDDKDIFQLFLDKETGFPVYMKEILFNPVQKKEIERNFYFRDYRNIDGLLVAQEIIVQQGKNSTETRKLKRLVINPSLKPQLFEGKQK